MERSEGGVSRSERERTDEDHGVLVGHEVEGGGSQLLNAAVEGVAGPAVEPVEMGRALAPTVEATARAKTNDAGGIGEADDDGERHVNIGSAQRVGVELALQVEGAKDAARLVAKANGELGRTVARAGVGSADSTDFVVASWERFGVTRRLARNGLEAVRRTRTRMRM